MNNFIFYPPLSTTPTMAVSGPLPVGLAPSGEGPPPSGPPAGMAIIPGIMQPSPAPPLPQSPPPDPPKPPPPNFVQGKPHWSQPREPGQEGAKIKHGECIIS
ncbi:hypothetical protein BDC45DRAFT_564798 [Circinella umbellata]|nr:hypothetical protein BDC45DRAFT_564798 [Circinella umbellata]